MPYRRGMELVGAVTVYRFPTVPEALAFYDGVLDNPDHDPDDTQLAQIGAVVLVCNSADESKLLCYEVEQELRLAEVAYAVGKGRKLSFKTRLIWLPAQADIEKETVLARVLEHLAALGDVVSEDVSLRWKMNPTTVILN